MVTEEPYQQVDEQDILVASDVGHSFQSPQFPADGVVGLGFGEFSNFAEDSFFGKLIKEGGTVASKPVFGLSLAESGSELVFGETDTSKFSGELTFVAVERTVSILRGVSCLSLTRTRYRVYGKSSWIQYQSMEITFQSALRK